MCPPRDAWLDIRDIGWTAQGQASCDQVNNTPRTPICKVCFGSKIECIPSASDICNILLLREISVHNQLVPCSYRINANRRLSWQGSECVLCVAKMSRGSLLMPVLAAY